MNQEFCLDDFNLSPEAKALCVRAEKIVAARKDETAAFVDDEITRSMYRMRARDFDVLQPPGTTEVTLYTDDINFLRRLMAYLLNVSVETLGELPEPYDHVLRACVCNAFFTYLGKVTRRKI